MTHNSNWFESPFPKACNFFNPQPLRAEPQPEAEESHWNKSIFISPEPSPPNFGNRANTQLSPWSKLINYQQESKLEHIVLPGFIPEQSENQHGINQKVFYSGGEDDDPVTPVRNEQLCKQEVEEGQLHTTGRKSELQATAKRSRPREKGLRKLSQRAFQIVQDLRNATYKEVAAKLVLQLNEEDLEGENKQEQNIKRRVYDALNVLIALGVLKKDGRRIVSETNKRGQKAQILKCQQLQALKMKLLSKTALLDQKRRKLREAQNKLQSITTLLRRNRENSFQRDEIIPFPFIGIFITTNSLDKVKQPGQDELMVRSQQPIQPFGDIDSLKWLKDSLERLTLEEFKSDGQEQ